MPDPNEVDLDRTLKEFLSSIENIQSSYSRLWQELRTSALTRNLPAEVLEGMAANVAHGIRNPLGGITNLVALLSEEVTPEQAPRVHRIKEGVQRIERIVEGLTVFGRPRKPSYVRCNVVDLVRRAVDLITTEPVCSAHTFALPAPQAEIYARVDPELTRQALGHIVRNAVEAMPEGGEIAIGVGRDARTDRVNVSVADQGSGLAGAEPEKLFLPFYTTKTNGMGLGLALAKMCVEAQDGSIRLDRNPDGGVTVTVSLPG